MRGFFTYSLQRVGKNCSWDDLFEKLKAQVRKHESFAIFCKNEELIKLNDWVNEQCCVTPQKREKLN